MQTHHAIQKFGRFRKSKTQIGGAQFGQLVARAQLRQRQLGVLTRANDQMHLRRQMLEEERERVVNRRRVNQMIIVQRQHKILRNDGKLIEQDSENRVGRGRLRRLKQCQNAIANLRKFFSIACGKRLQCRDEIREKTRGVAVTLIEREPRNRRALLITPFTHQRRFAKTGGRGDQRQLAMQRLVEPRAQARTNDNLRARRRDEKFGCQNRRGHGGIIKHAREDFNASSW